MNVLILFALNIFEQFYKLKITVIVKMISKSPRQSLILSIILLITQTIELFSSRRDYSNAGINIFIKQFNQLIPTEHL